VGRNHSSRFRIRGSKLVESHRWSDVLPVNSSFHGVDSFDTTDNWFRQRCQYRRNGWKQIFKGVADSDNHDDKEAGMCQILLELYVLIRREQRFEAGGLRSLEEFAVLQASPMFLLSGSDIVRG